MCILGIFGCEMFQEGRLCGCNTLHVVSAFKESYPVTYQSKVLPNGGINRHILRI